MAKKRASKKTGAAAIPDITLDTDDRGPSFSIDAVVCLGATLYNVREAVQKTAIKRAKGKHPVPLSAMKVALLEHGLGWALQSPDEKESKRDV